MGEVLHAGVPVGKYQRLLLKKTGVPSDASMMEDIAYGGEAQGIKREVAIASVADWSFARKASLSLEDRKRR